jgi:hypothetical protein
MPTTNSFARKFSKNRKLPSPLLGFLEKVLWILDIEAPEAM